MTTTFGPTFDPALDEERLNDQILRVYRLMVDQQWRTLGEIAQETGDPEASISAQLRHLRKPKFGSFEVDKRRRGLATTGLWEYCLLPPGSVPTYSAPARRPSKKNPFLAGMMHAAKVVLKASDLPSAKAALKAELLRTARP